MKYWIVPNSMDPTKFSRVGSSVRPKNAIGLAPDGEDPAWLQVELIDDGDGNMVETITVNQPTKDAVLQQRFDDQQARDAAKAAADAAKQAKIDKVKNINTNTLNGLDDLKQAIADIQAWIADQEQ